MQAYVMLHFDADEVRKQIPYPLIAESYSGSRWSTGKRKRLARQWFTPEEWEACLDLCKLARRWYLITGVPETVTMRTTTFALWQKLADFCMNL